MLRVTIAVRPGLPADVGAAARLLERAQLPLAGFDERVRLVVATDEDGCLVGSAALEEYQGGALLRSVAVDERARGAGIGQRLTLAALDLARQRGHREVYLLTTTAERFFPRFGFRRIERAEVPADVRASVEFTSACPSSAVIMRADVGAG